MNRIKNKLFKILFLEWLLCLSLPAIAQDNNILQPIAEIERRLKFEPFEIFRFRDSRFEGDITKRAILKCPDGIYIQCKWKRAAKGGYANNNEPRYEIAAYELQKLFLDPDDYVVPPTVGRSLPLGQYLTIEPYVEPTFKNTSSVFFVLQYWLEEVSADNILDKKRFKADSTYARHLGDMNILSYLIEHKDSNIGNFLISTDPDNPRVFVVDNSLAFSSPKSDRGYEWKKIRVKRLPAKTIDRLRKIQKADLERTLGVVANYEIKNGQLIPATAAANL
ncbi:MAG: hypothetical protein ACE5HI_20100, partial [bacterium]